MDSRPWSAVPAQRSSTDKLKTRRRIIWGVLALVLLSGPTSCMISSSALSAAKESSQATAGLSVAAAAAQTVAWSFLSGAGSPIATVSGLDPELGQTKAGVPFGKVDSLSYAGTTAVPDTTKGSTRQFEVSHFWVQSAGITYDLAVTTTEGQGGPVLAAPPSMARVITAPGDATGPTFANTPGTLPPSRYPGLTSRVEIWATAYGAGDINRLGEISENGPTYTVALGSAPSGAGDTADPGVTYTPAATQIVSMYQRKDGTVVAQVSVTYTNAANKFTMSNTYDLVVDLKGDDGGLSVIREWGPTGQFDAAGN